MITGVYASCILHSFCGVLIICVYSWDLACQPRATAGQVGEGSVQRRTYFMHLDAISGVSLWVI